MIRRDQHMISVSDYYEDFHAERGKTGTVEFPERINFIHAEVGRDKDVIELGCRFGGLLRYFNDGNPVVGVDADRVALAKCAEAYGVTTQLVDLSRELPFAGETFDVAVMSEVLEHLPYPEVSLSEARRVLRPGGKFVGSVPNGTRLRNRLTFLTTGVVDVDRTHLRFFSVESLGATLAQYFVDVSIQPVAGRFVGISPPLFANCLLFKGYRAI